MLIHRENVRDWLIAVAIVLVGAVLLAVLQVVMAHADCAAWMHGHWVHTCGANQPVSSGEITAYPASAPDVINLPATAATDDIRSAGMNIGLILMLVGAGMIIYSRWWKMRRRRLANLKERR
jgi:hypothetical protein